MKPRTGQPGKGRPLKGHEIGAEVGVYVKWPKDDLQKARDLAAEHGVSLSEWLRRRGTTTGGVQK